MSLESNRDQFKKISTSTQVQLLTEMVQQCHVCVEIDVPTLNVTGEMLKKKALFFRDKILLDFAECLTSSDTISLQSFVASNGWLEKYLKHIST